MSLESANYILSFNTWIDLMYIKIIGKNLKNDYEVAYYKYKFK